MYVPAHDLAAAAKAAERARANAAEAQRRLQAERASELDLCRLGVHRSESAEAEAAVEELILPDADNISVAGEVEARAAEARVKAAADPFRPILPDTDAVDAAGEAELTRSGRDRSPSLLSMQQRASSLNEVDGAAAPATAQVAATAAAPDQEEESEAAAEGCGADADEEVGALELATTPQARRAPPSPWGNAPPWSNGSEALLTPQGASPPPPPRLPAVTSGEEVSELEEEAMLGPPCDDPPMGSEDSLDDEDGVGALGPAPRTMPPLASPPSSRALAPSPAAPPQRRPSLESSSSSSSSPSLAVHSPIATGEFSYTPPVEAEEEEEEEAALAYAIEAEAEDALQSPISSPWSAAGERRGGEDSEMSLHIDRYGAVEVRSANLSAAAEVAKDTFVKQRRASRAHQSVSSEGPMPEGYVPPQLLDISDATGRCEYPELMGRYVCLEPEGELYGREGSAEGWGDVYLYRLLLVEGEDDGEQGAVWMIGDDDMMAEQEGALESTNAPHSPLLIKFEDGMSIHEVGAKVPSPYSSPVHDGGEGGAGVAVETKSGSALLAACAAGDEDAANALLDSGAVSATDVAQLHRSGINALWLACHQVSRNALSLSRFLVQAHCVQLN